MMGERRVGQGALFYEFSLERHVPHDHLLRSIDRFVDLDGVRAHLASFYSPIGRPSIDPELMIRMLLVGYCLGIRSERRLCEEVHLNLAYRWFCRLGLDGDVPDHSTFSKNRHGRFRESNLLRELFESVVRRCMAEGLVGGEGFAVDASLIKADANRQSGTDGAKGLDPEVTSRAVEEYLAVLDDAAFGGATAVVPKYLAPADPASRWTGANGGMAFYAYSTNYLIDLKHAVIVEVEASTAIRQAEVTACKTMIVRAKDRFDLHPDRLAADTAYGSAEMLNWLVNDQRIEPHVPVFDKSERTDGTLSRADFVYDVEADAYTCPAGNALHRRRRRFKTPRPEALSDDTIRYRASKRDCDDVFRGRPVAQLAGHGFFALGDALLAVADQARQGAHALHQGRELRRLDRGGLVGAVHAAVEGDVRQYGMAKEGLIAKQFMLGVVQTADGLPIYHEVFDGNTAETKTLLPTIKKVMARFPHLRRLVLVADRGLLSLDNLEALQAIHLSPRPGQTPSQAQALEFIIAVPGRRYGEFTDLLEPLQAQWAQAKAEMTGEIAWGGQRLIVAHDPAAAAQQHQQRLTQIAQLEAQAKSWEGKLTEQDEGIKKRGRKLSDSGTKARFYHAVCEANLGKIIKVDMKAELFSYVIDDEALKLAELMDGKLLVVTNVADLTPEQIIERYKSLADIERGFKVLKSELEIGPVYHRLPERIRAHASICFMALILHRVMRMRLRAADTGITPERALAALKRIQHHQVSIDGAPSLCGVSSMTDEHHIMLAALKVKKPKQSEQLSLL